MQTLKQNILKYISSFGIVQDFFKGKGVILMLHRIAPYENKLSPNENMKVAPEFLEDFIVKSLEAGYEFISLDRLYDGLISGDLPEYFLCITIDDGYKDNLTFGYPIFAKYQIPFCIYVCTSFPQRSANMWWFALEDYLLENDSIHFNNHTYDISSIVAKEAMFMQIRNALITQNTSYEHSGLKSFGIEYNPRDYDSLALTWEDIAYLDRQMATFEGGGGQKLCTIGNHTHSHPIFNQLTTEQIIEDITKAQNLFKEHLGYTPLHFGYPFGGRIEVDSSHFETIKNLGFLSATTTRHGSIYYEHKGYLHSLPRVFFSPNFVIESAFKFRKKRVVTN